MANYMHKAGGTFADGGFWSVGMSSTSAVSEAAAETAWHTAVLGFWESAAWAALLPAGTALTYTSTSTASATWHQTTKTITNATVPGGDDTNSELPSHDAFIVTLRSAQATRYGHGRWYWPAPTVAALAIGTGGHLTAAAQTAAQSALGALFNGLNTGGLTPVLVTRSANVSGVPLYTTRQIVACDFPDTLAIQNRRSDKIVPARTPVTV